MTCLTRNYKFKFVIPSWLHQDISWDFLENQLLKDDICFLNIAVDVSDSLWYIIIHCYNFIRTSKCICIFTFIKLTQKGDFVGDYIESKLFSKSFLLNFIEIHRSSDQFFALFFMQIIFILKGTRLTVSRITFGNLLPHSPTTTIFSLSTWLLSWWQWE